MHPLRIAFGPEAPAFSSWEWVGADLCRALDTWFSETAIFFDAIPDCDIVVFVKFLPPRDELQHQKSLSRKLIFFPVDIYDSAASIDADATSLQCLDWIVVHCERLRKYLAPYAPVAYLDHHLKFLADPPPTPPTSGPILWIGNRSNLPPVVEWINHQRLQDELWVLTDFPSDNDVQPASILGFTSSQSIRIGRWTPERHRAWAALARAALDVKGDDFRARHKPPTKALDFLASGVPLAMNSDSSSSEHLLQRYGFRIAELEDRDRWLSRDYWQEVQSGIPLWRSELSLAAIAQRFQRIVTASD